MQQTQIIPAAGLRDHGGGLDAAVARYGGTRADWIDLSTGINPQPYPVGGFQPADWTDLPDRAAVGALEFAARKFWNVPEDAGILAAPGASSLIARMPLLAPRGRVQITMPTYNEHAAAFQTQGWQVVATGPADARVLVHPNNPDGRVWQESDAAAPLTIIDESFCDVMPDRSLIRLANRGNVIVLKSFGKFWGLAGLRLGFAIAAPGLIQRLSDALGPWPVSGPGLRIGAEALGDADWTQATRTRLADDRARLDQMMQAAGAELAGGTDLFRLYSVKDAAEWQDRLARHHIWTRIFPYSRTFLRLGLPPEQGWSRLEQAL